MEKSTLMRAWKEASNDLGIEVIAPYILKSSEGQQFEYAALVKCFGSDKGMLVLASWDREMIELAEACGFGWSWMGTPSYDRYDREAFVDALVDWGWTGSEGAVPEWYAETDSR